jgi:alpha-L-fucosidase
MEVTRRQFAASALLAAAAGRRASAGKRVPGYLKDYAVLHARDPHAAGLAWFRDARFGLFVHYSRRSLVKGANGKKPPFRPERFDAAAIADLALKAQMRYVNFTPYHGGGPFLFRTAASDDTAPKLLGRDLVTEMAEACRERDLGLFLYIHISIGRSHPEVFDRNQAILRELLTQYGPLAGIWFDSVHDYYRHPEMHPRLGDHYRLVRKLQPQALISLKQGATGDEDFLACEHRVRPPAKNSALSPEARRKLAGKPVEICTTLQWNREKDSGVRMWFDIPGAYHRTPAEVMAVLADARRQDANLLLNTGPRGDGSIHPADATTLAEVGRRIAADGWPPAPHAKKDTP